MPLDEVEPVSEIVKRFNTGAMSYGSISAEAHETLAVAMNSIGAKSNTGEGGEDSDRLNDPVRRSAHQADRLGPLRRDQRVPDQRGRHPDQAGPGRQARRGRPAARSQGVSRGWPGPGTRTPGSGLISPPPHHDIYSIEDLAPADPRRQEREPAGAYPHQARAASSASAPSRRVWPRRTPTSCSSRVTTAARAASPATSLKHAGTPWEIGLAETAADARAEQPARPRRRAGRRSAARRGRDVVIGALLGAEEFGFATAAARASRGCIMMRVCHLDTCPVGVATQNPELRARFTGKPEFVVTFMEFIAQEVRRAARAAGLPHAARGGRARRAARHARRDRPLEGRGSGPRPRARGPVAGRRHRAAPDHAAGPRPGPCPRQPADRAGRATRSSAREPVRIALPVRNVNRTVGTMLGHEVTKRFGGAGLPDDTIDVTLTGSAGPVVRRVPAPRHHAAAVRRRQRLRRQGSVGRAHRDPPRPQRGALLRAQRRGGQRHRLRRHDRADLSARPGRRAVRRPQLRCDARRRGRRRPRLRVHDRRHRRWCSAARAATSAPACRAVRPTCSTWCRRS